MELNAEMKRQVEALAQNSKRVVEERVKEIGFQDEKWFVSREVSTFLTEFSRGLAEKAEEIHPWRQTCANCKGSTIYDTDLDLDDAWRDNEWVPIFPNSDGVLCRKCADLRDQEEGEQR